MTLCRGCRAYLGNVSRPCSLGFDPNFDKFLRWTRDKYCSRPTTYEALQREEWLISERNKRKKSKGE